MNNDTKERSHAMKKLIRRTLENTGLVIFGMVLLTAFCLILVGCTEKAEISVYMKQFKQISIIEHGVVDGYSYKLIQDNETGRRILYFGQAMVVLPEKEQ